MYTLRDSSLVVNGYADFEAHAGSFDATRWRYDEATGLLTNKVYADGRGTAYRYTPDGKLETRNWARGVTTDYAYDPATRELVGIDYSDATPDVNLAYDRLGRQVRVTDAQGSRTFVYTNTLELISETIGAGEGATRLSRSWDPLGRPAGISLGTDYAVRYGYDAWGRFASLSSVIGPLSSSNLFTYAYLPDSDLLAGYVATNPVSSFQFQVSRAYEPHRDLLTMVSNAWDAALSSAYAYQNDAVGRRVQRVDAVGGSGSTPTATNRFAYNLRSEVTNAVMPMGSATNLYAYRYDPIGNRTHSVSNAETLLYTANELNQYSRIYPAEGGVGTLPVYDADGNMVAWGDWVYGWDAENRLISAEPATPQLGDRKVELAYDFMSRRVSKSTLQYDLSGWDVVEEKDFAYDGWNLVVEAVKSSGLPSTNRYVWGLDLSGTLQGAGGIGGLLYLARGPPGDGAFAAFDGNGNLTALLSTNGSVAAEYLYGPFGETIRASGPLAAANPFRFSTKYTDCATGLVYFGYRYLKDGRWLSRDPIGERDAVNIYAFVRNNAVVLVDYLGLQGCTVHIWIGHGYEIKRQLERYKEDKCASHAVFACKAAAWADQVVSPDMLIPPLSNIPLGGMFRGNTDWQEWAHERFKWWDGIFTTDLNPWVEFQVRFTQEMLKQARRRAARMALDPKRVCPCQCETIEFTIHRVTGSDLMPWQAMEIVDRFERYSPIIWVSDQVRKACCDR